ncbi:protocadherin Fat 4 [Patella vulgata]|uniref:protocadherin Fat 4 n=1 Tax=Patella vulgata TaxID=6465 RepID=UPI0021802AE5|nr:protocadherin Fat 4 [Patella vulgata]
MKRQIYLEFMLLFFLLLFQETKTASCTNANINVDGRSPIGTIVGDLGCTGTNLNIVSGDTNNMFSVDNQGKLTTKRFLYESLDYKYELTIDGVDNVIQVAVTYVNTAAPLFSNLPASIEVDENTPIGTQIYTFSFSDADKATGGLGGVAYVDFFKPGANAAKKWIIERATGAFYVNTVFDVSVKSKYTLGIQAYDMHPTTPKKSGKQVLTISLKDANTHSPGCSKYSKLISLKENVSVNTTVDALNCTDKDKGANAALSYRLAESNSQDVKDTFKFESNQLKLKSELDYETATIYNIVAEVYDGGPLKRTTTVQITVNVEDFDDNIPEWPETTLYGSVSETAPLGTIILNATASDGDSPGIPSTITYGIQTKAAPDCLSIDPDTGSITLSKSISDFVNIDWISMEIFAYSSNQVLSKSTIIVNITIIDENNIVPQFSQSSYQVSVNESQPIGSSILTVSATDPEFGDNGEIEYYLTSTLFAVDLNGVVLTTALLDFETSNVHTLTILAKDKGTPTQTGSAVLLIRILPENEHDPIIEGPIAAISIAEDTPPGAVLSYINATDQDGGLDGDITFSIQNPLDPFTIEPKTGLFRVGSALDREFKDTWEVVVIAVDDSETAPRTTSTTVTISITDINDNTPICEPLPDIIVTLPHQIGRQLATLKCTDLDEGDNAELTFEISSGNTNPVFGINEMSGVITLEKSLTEDRYTLTIDIQDKGSTQRKTNIILTILAEISFTFSALPATINNITENTQQALRLFHVQACCVFGAVQYEIVSGNEDNRVAIDPSTGTVISLKSFDREFQSTYIYNIKAINSNTNTTVESELTVEINDLNDVTPTFDTSLHFVNVFENVSISTSIYAVTALDNDLDKNGEIVYSIQGGNNGPAFEIDNNSGNLILKSKLDADIITQYSLVIVATDKGDTPLTGTTTVVIKVKTINDFKPKVLNAAENGLIFTNVTENEALGAIVFVFRAQDQDNNTDFTYMISQGNDDKTFIIDGEKGDIYLRKILDRETVNNYNLTVDVDTADGDKVSAVVVIDVLDVNDNDPKFSTDVHQYEVIHEDPMDKVIATFTITDRDIGSNADIASLSITDGDSSGRFKIVNNDILTNVQVDYNTGIAYSLTITATDSGNPARSSSIRVIIKVLPKFKPPRFAMTEYNAPPLSEDIYPGSEVFDVNATVDGATEGSDGTMQYSIASGNTDNAFYISDTDGKIFTATTMDFEKLEAYALNIEARSKEDSTKSDTTLVKITIKNINDHTPTFTKPLYTFNIDEKTAPPVDVGQVSANDLDKIPYGNITYSLGTFIGSTDFTINTNGMLQTTEELDFMTQNLYSIPVMASDGGVIKGEALAVIVVNDINDNAPAFSPDNVNISVIESFGVGQTFHTVKATDLDTGINGQITYQIQSSFTEFALDPVSGALTIASSLDRETKDNFNLIIIAVDNATTDAKTGTLTMTITVTDANDHDPAFNVANMDVTINRFDSPGVFVYKAVATDGDIGGNSAVEYEISSGNNDDLFVIGASSGEIKTISSVRNANNQYSLTITARDKGLPTRSSSMMLNIEIIPFNLGVVSDQTISIKESTGIAVEVAMITRKTNHANSADLRYNIVNGNYKSSFNLDPLTGKLTTAGSLDREEYPLFILTINISDTAIPSYTKIVTVNVTDVNDNAPVFHNVDTSVDIVENIPAGLIITSFTVTDADEGVNGEFDLTIENTEPNVQEHFELTGNTLRLKKPLDYEVFNSITVKVVSTDRGASPQQNYVDILINVIDVVDANTVNNGSTEKPPIYITKEISSNVEKDSVVTKLISNDFGVSTPVETENYFLLGDDEIFNIQQSGNVAVTSVDGLDPNKKFFLSVKTSIKNSADDKDLLGLVRIDTFDPNKHVVSLESPNAVATLESYKDTILDSLNNFYPDDEPRIWKIQNVPTTSRRRLLAASSSVLVYVMDGKHPNTLEDITSERTFKTSDSMMGTLRKDPANDEPMDALKGNANYEIISVNGHSEPLRKSPDSAENDSDFISSLEGQITLGVVGLILLLFLILIIVFIIYKKKKRDQRRKNGSSENLVGDINRNERSQGIIIPKGLGKAGLKKEKVETTESPTSRPSRKTSRGPVDTALPNNEKSSSKKRTASVSPARFSPMSPATPASTPSKSDSLDVTRDNSPKRSSPKPAERRPLPALKQEKQPSTIDPNKTGNGKDDQVTPGIAKRKNGPIVHHGKEYDGVGFDGDKQQRYAYNTRTGSTLWVDEKNGGKTGGQKKPGQPITVVSAPKSEFKPDLTTNRSIGMISQK